MTTVPDMSSEETDQHHRLGEFFLRVLHRHRDHGCSLLRDLGFRLSTFDFRL
jgi:hypothetical protein